MEYKYKYLLYIAFLQQSKIFQMENIYVKITQGFSIFYSTVLAYYQQKQKKEWEINDWVIYSVIRSPLWPTRDIYEDENFMFLLQYMYRVVKICCAYLEWLNMQI